MGGAWFTEYADELARLLVDARECAEACEAYLEEMRARGDAEALTAAVTALAAPAAVAHVLIDLVDQPPQLVHAVARLCRDSATAAIDGIESPEVVDALRRVSASADALLDASA